MFLDDKSHVRIKINYEEIKLLALSESSCLTVSFCLQNDTDIVRNIDHKCSNSSILRLLL